VAPEALKARQHEVTALADHLRRLPAIDWRPLQPGQDLYVQHCATCHGIYGHPSKTADAAVDRPPLRDLSDATFQRDTADERLRALVLDGHGGQHPSPALGPTDAAAVAGYMRLLSPGYELYSRFCANCHGDDGRGSAYFAEMTPRPTIVFDESYFASHDAAYVNDRIWHMVSEKKPHMPHLKHEVSETAAREIIVFLKDLQD
jgi:mono/diheme cytochrome c family protein